MKPYLVIEKVLIDISVIIIQKVIQISKGISHFKDSGFLMSFLERVQ